MIRNDEPITEPDEDVLGRARIAEVIAGEIRSIDASSGAVIGILGPWGAGKTSLINLLRNELKGPPWIRSISFNPWMFSGSDQLVDRFFSELAAQLRSEPGRFSQLADALEDYGEVVSPLQFIPVVGSWVGWLTGAGKALKDLRSRRKGGIEQQRDQVSRKLKDLDSPIVVVIDDIDRLPTGEIRDVFKLVRLTANFPNIIYLVAFDRLRVERALTEQGLPGRDYLEKIVQVVYDLPAIPEAVLGRQVAEAIDEALAGMEVEGPFNPDRWPDAFLDVIRPLVRNMRDVRRYAGSLRGTVRSLDGEVELVDVLALEAVRMFLPDVFATAMASQEALTTPASGASTFDDLRDARAKPVIEALLEAGKERPDVVRAMVERLFPAAARYLEHGHGVADSSATYLRERRVAHPEVFAYYCERVAGAGLQAFKSAERAFRLLTDKDALDAYFRSLDPSEWENVISALEAYENEFPVEAALPATVVLLNLVPEIPERPRGFFDFDARQVVTRVVFRLLRRLPDAGAIEETVRAALPQITTLREKLSLLNLVGHEEDLGQRLISGEASQELEAALREEIRSATPQALAREQQIRWLVTWTKKNTAPSEPALELSPDPALGSALLKGAVSEVRSYPTGTRSVRVEKRFQLESLVEQVGSEDAVRQIIEQCRDQAEDPALTEAIGLAERYLSGWRPERF